MRSILLTHAGCYPLMEPRDAVKLLYQNEFGGGHLIRNQGECLDRLRREYEATAQDPGLALTENIGGGMLRVYLGALDHHRLPVETLGRAFLRSARPRGSMASFRQKLGLLREMTASGELPFAPEALERWLTDYEQAGFPVVSHSDAYRAAYRPAYRVVARDILEWEAGIVTEGNPFRGRAVLPDGSQ